MVYDSSNIPTDVTQLQELVITLSESNARQQETLDQQKKTLDQLVAEVSRLNVYIEQLLEMIFGKKSEKQSKEKSADESKNKSPSAETSKNTESNGDRQKREKNGGGGRMELPAHLERVEKVIDVPEEERTCDCCGKSFKCIGEERSEQLHFRPIEFYVVVQVLLKYLAACDCSAKRSVTAESPIKTIDKGVASTSVVAAIAVMKYADHLPLARQANQVFKRSGLELSQSSMCRWMGKIADMLEPLYDLICELILFSYCLGIDATNVKYRDPGVQGKCKTGFVWGAVGDEHHPYNVYFFRRDGTRAGLESIVKNYSKVLRCDAHSIYDTIFEPRLAVEADGSRLRGRRSMILENDSRPCEASEGNCAEAARFPIEQGCWSHGRRYFHKAHKIHPDARHVLTLIGSMYGVERRAKKLTPDERLAMRQRESIPLLDQVFDWCREHKEKYLPKDPLNLAIQYLLNHEAALRVYCIDGRLAIDNNETERMLRLAAIGRKNWMFFGSDRGGKTGCILYTILGSARRHGLNEFEYLCDILDRLSDLPSEGEYLNLLPDRWEKQAK